MYRSNIYVICIKGKKYRLLKKNTYHNINGPDRGGRFLGAHSNNTTNTLILGDNGHQTWSNTI